MGADGDSSVSQHMSDKPTQLHAKLFDMPSNKKKRKDSIQEILAFVFYLCHKRYCNPVESLIPLGSFASKEAGIASADFFALCIVVVFTSEQAGRAVADAASVGITVVGTSEETRSAAADFPALCVIVIH